MEDKIYSVLEKYGIDEPKASAITEDLLVLCAVVKSLPSKEELTIELSNKLIDIFDADETWEKEHYKYGFNACFAFIKEYLTK